MIAPRLSPDAPDAPCEARDVACVSALAALDALRVELADLAFDLERRGRADAADLAGVIRRRVAEVHDTLSAGILRKEGGRGDAGRRSRAIKPGFRAQAQL